MNKRRVMEAGEPGLASKRAGLDGHASEEEGRAGPAVGSSPGQAEPWRARPACLPRAPPPQRQVRRAPCRRPYPRRPRRPFHRRHRRPNPRAPRCRRCCRSTRAPPSFCATGAAPRPPPRACPARPRAGAAAGPRPRARAAPRPPSPARRTRRVRLWGRAAARARSARQLPPGRTRPPVAVRRVRCAARGSSGGGGGEPPGRHGAGRGAAAAGRRCGHGHRIFLVRPCGANSSSLLSSGAAPPPAGAWPPGAAGSP
jgi:hypothetical protein